MALMTPIFGAFCSASAPSGTVRSAPRPLTKARRFMAGGMVGRSSDVSKVQWRRERAIDSAAAIVPGSSNDPGRAAARVLRANRSRPNDGRRTLQASRERAYPRRSEPKGDPAQNVVCLDVGGEAALMVSSNSPAPPPLMTLARRWRGAHCLLVLDGQVLRPICFLSISGPTRSAAGTGAPGDATPRTSVEPRSSTSPGHQHTSRARRVDA